MRTYLYIGLAVIMAAILFIMCSQCNRIRDLESERNKYRENTESLLTDIERFRVRDSLNAARVQSLELTAKEYERFRAEDARLIRELESRNRDLAAVSKTQSETIIDLISAPKDTVIIRDSVQLPATAFHCGDAWFDFNGVLADGEFSGTLSSRDSLLLSETVKYKRFLRFLWKTHKIKDRHFDCVSRNPHTTILGLEHIIINN